MQHINHYAILRNTATYEAYQARNRAVLRAGQPFTILAAAFGAVPYWAGLSFFFHPAHGRSLGQGHPYAVPFLMHLNAGLVGVCTVGFAVCTVLAFIRIRRYRRDHPIPDAWLLGPKV